MGTAARWMISSESSTRGFSSNKHSRSFSNLLRSYKSDLGYGNVRITQFIVTGHIQGRIRLISCNQGISPCFANSFLFYSSALQECPH